MIKGFKHIGISVSNLERSVEFYRNGLGLEVVFHGTFEGEKYETILRLAGATGKVALLERSELQIELFEFARPIPKAGEVSRPVCDHGITHFCIEVTDIEGECARLKAAGASFHCEPLKFGTTTATYGRDPDGNVFELAEWPRESQCS